MCKTINSSSVLARWFLLTLVFAAPACVGQDSASTQPSKDPSIQDNSQAQPPPTDLVIGPGDLLQISVYGAPDFNEQVRVSSDGEISLPMIGSIKMEGLSVSQAQQTITQRLTSGEFFAEPRVSVFVKEYSSQGISVLGEVQKPGIYSLLGSRRLFDAISAAGGTTAKAGNSVSIRHRYTPNLAQEVMYEPHSTSANVQLLPGDTVVVSRAGFVYVGGDVKLPSGIILDKPLTVLQALAMAQGANPNASLDNAKLIRYSAGVRTEQSLPLKKILEGKVPDVQLQADDVVFVPMSGAKSAIRRSMELVLQTASGIAIYRH